MTDNAAMRILLAEDDPALGRGLQMGLSQEAIAVDWARDGIAAFSEFRVRLYDALVLDLGLPGMTGFALLERIRKTDSLVPIIVVSARDAVADRIRGLDLGADDYLAKPFELAELVARLRAVSRRVGGHQGRTITIGDVEVDLIERSVKASGREVALSVREFAVLRLLLESQGAVSRARINELISQGGVSSHENQAVACIHGLRRKLGSDFIRTYRGWGYRIRT